MQAIKYHMHKQTCARIDLDSAQPIPRSNQMKLRRRCMEIRDCCYISIESTCIEMLTLVRSGRLHVDALDCVVVFV